MEHCAPLHSACATILWRAQAVPLSCRRWRSNAESAGVSAVSPHQNPSNSLHWSVLCRGVSIGLISPESLSLTMRRAAPLDFQELARASSVARQSLTFELKGSRPEV